MARPHPPEGVHRPTRLRRIGAVLTSLCALVATTVVAGPAVAATAAGGCAMARTDAHHSEGLNGWNAEYPRPVRSLDAVMVFLSFPGSTPSMDTATLAADHSPATANFYKRASYGRFDLRIHPQRRWIEMPRPAVGYGIRRDWDPGARSAYLRDAIAVADPEVDFSRYDIVYLVADPEAPGVDADATKVVNFDQPLHADGTALPRLVTVFEHHPPDHNVLAHETGHVFDLPDLYHRPAGGDGDWDTHVGDWDLMGSQFGLAPEPFGWHKWKLGWLGGRQVACVRTTGVSRYTLVPVSAPMSPGAPGTSPASAAGPGVDDRTRLVVVRTGPESALVVEARGAYGNDLAACRDGVLVYRVRGDIASGEGPIQVLDAHPRTGACWNESVWPALADAPLRVGERMRVPEDGATVAVTGRASGGGWNVTVTHRTAHP